MSIIPDWIKKGREQWEYRGQKRPAFAIEPKERQESVWDYPRPPKLVLDRRVIRVIYKSLVIAETRNAFRVLETASPPTFYIPPLDINMNILESGAGSSLCEWKGKAGYWSLKSGSTKLTNIGWSYPDSFPEFEQIKNYLSFYPSKVECFVNDEQVKPQPGGFYGGWITSEIVGPVKGEIPEASL